jgi:hypothetical protein
VIDGSDCSHKVILKLSEVFFVLVVYHETAMVSARYFNDGWFGFIARLDRSGETME